MAKRKKDVGHKAKDHTEPGFKKMPLPGPDDLRPGMRDLTPHYGTGRSVLDCADGNRMVHDFGSPKGYPAQSPSRPDYTPGLRKSPKEGETDPAALTIQFGIPRNR